jgi:hypothetical protein
MASGITNDKLDACCLTEYYPLPGNPQGELINIDGINCYHIKGKDQTSKEKSIVILTDVFGMLLLFDYIILKLMIGLTKNPRMTADELSEKSGFDVYVPDLFNGDPIESSLLKNMPQAPGEKMSLGTKVS